MPCPSEIYFGWLPKSEPVLREIQLTIFPRNGLELTSIPSPPPMGHLWFMMISAGIEVN